MARPEHQNPPEIFYNASEAKKYAVSSRMIDIQTRMTERALELLCLPPGQGKLILDIGCGTGLSGEVLQKAGHFVVGIDISLSMLEVAREKGAQEKEFDCLEWDMGQGFGFRPGAFDGIVSISALQWLCNADTKAHNPIRRINRFFNTLYACMSRGSRAVFQFYPENVDQLTLLTGAALKAGFTGGLLVDYPNSAKAKKYFLVVFAGQLPNQQHQMPVALGQGLDDEEPEEHIPYSKERRSGRGSHERVKPKTKEWILNKKNRARLQGRQVGSDSKYTARRRIANTKW